MRSRTHQHRCWCECFHFAVAPVLAWRLRSSNWTLIHWRFYFRCGFSGPIALLFLKFLFVMVAEKNVMCRWKVMLERLIWERP